MEKSTKCKYKYKKKCLNQSTLHERYEQVIKRVYAKDITSIWMGKKCTFTYFETLRVQLYLQAHFFH